MIDATAFEEVVGPYFIAPAAAPVLLSAIGPVLSVEFGLAILLDPSREDAQGGSFVVVLVSAVDHYRDSGLLVDCSDA